MLGPGGPGEGGGNHSQLPSPAQAAESLRRTLPFLPAVGLVLGSGLGAFGDTLAEPVRIPYVRIPGFPAAAVAALPASAQRLMHAWYTAGWLHLSDERPAE